MKLRTFFFLALILCNLHVIIGQIRLPKLISDGLILQRDTELKIWGWSSPNENIKIQFKEDFFKATANSLGEWEITLPKQKAGGPYTMEFNGKNRIVLKDILIGDVWLCSGQSNMSFEMKNVSKVYPEDIEKSTNNEIRQFLVPNNYNFNKAENQLKSGKWISANPKSVLDFSAVAYFFAKNLYDKHQIPIGLINSSVGGTPAEAWVSEDAVKFFPHYYNELQLLKNKDYIDNLKNSNVENEKNWISNVNKLDLGLIENWKSEHVDDSKWETINLPNSWVKKVDYKHGVVWFRKKINLNRIPNMDNAQLNLGRISDADSVFVNGKFIGTTANKYISRNYKIPKGILKKGNNTISIRVFSYRYTGGFIKENTMNLSFDDFKIKLNNLWKFKLGIQSSSLERPIQLTRKPAGLYNAMISPLLNYKIKGAIWYQGEGNASKAKEYNELFPSLIRNWRTKFNQGDFPFLFVQLANYQKTNKEPTSGGWANLREAQLNTLEVKNTGMAVTIDIGEENDIHPKNKKDVGCRLSWEAERIAYGSITNTQTPIFQSMKIENNKIILSFSNGDSLKLNEENSLKYFAIAGLDQKFVWAKASILDNKIVVYSEEILNPIAVRYAWANNPEGVNLFDVNNLPISPFRTDDW